MPHITVNGFNNALTALPIVTTKFTSLYCNLVPVQCRLAAVSRFAPDI